MRKPKIVKMKTLKMTVGLPRSGKSTWAREQGCPIVNPDSIRLALHGQAFAPLAEPFIWAIAKVMVRALFLSGHDVVVLDATNTTKKRREMWASKNWNRAFKVVETPMKICIERAKDSNPDLIPVIRTMHKEYEPVEADEK